MRDLALFWGRNATTPGSQAHFSLSLAAVIVGEKRGLCAVFLVCCTCVVVSFSEDVFQIHG